MPVFKNMKDVRKYLQKKIDDALANDVFEAVKKVELENITDVVIDAYSPTAYARRDARGIEDPANIVAAPPIDGVLEVENCTAFNPDYGTKNTGRGLVGLIENGYGWQGYRYDYPYNRKFTKPRPFISHTREDLQNGLQHVHALKNGLRKRGIKVKF